MRSFLGILIFNFNPAKIFLGDSGAMLLGFLLGSITVLNSMSQSTTMTLFIPILVLGVPIFDTGLPFFVDFYRDAVLLKRIRIIFITDLFRKAIHKNRLFL